MYDYYGYGSGYGYGSSLAKSSGASTIWVIIAAVLALVGGLVIYFTFLSKKNEGKFTGFLGWLYSFLTFKKMMIESILKVCYLILALFITLASFALISVNFLSFLGTLVVGNLVARISYEFLLVALVICKNTTEINAKMKEENKTEE